MPVSLAQGMQEKQNGIGRKFNEHSYGESTTVSLHVSQNDGNHLKLLKL
jgi:hypothetical protein